MSIPLQPVTIIDSKELLLFASGLLTTGNNVIWTPQLNCRWRLRGVSITVDPATTTTAGSVVTLMDGANKLDDLLVLGTAAFVGPFRAASSIPGEGIRSALPNNTLSVNLSAAVLTGGLYVNVWGIEE